MNSYCKVALFTAHQGDPLSDLIMAEEGMSYTHAALLTDKDRMIIYEQYDPCARFRPLSPSEVPAIQFFDIQGWDAKKDAALRRLITKRAADKIPYWVRGLFLFEPEFRFQFGFWRWILHRCRGKMTPTVGMPQDWAKHAFCSMEVFEDIRLQGVKLLNANCWQVSPGILSMSPLLIPAEF